MPALLFVLAAFQSAPQAAPLPGGARLAVELGVTEAGAASERWQDMIRKRSEERYRAIRGVRKPLTGAERAWAELIRSRVGMWEREIPALARLFEPVGPPASAVIVLGNQGGEDAFTHDPTTVGFDLAALVAVYGHAGSAENRERINRLFRHEYVHLLQKAWIRVHPYRAGTPLREAVAEMWGEGIGNYFSMSDPWRAREGRVSPRAAEALATLEPRLVARLAALAHATPEEAARLTADLSNGRFDRKWGALPVALWLDAEAGRSADAVRRLVLAGPDGVWELAERRLPERLAAVLREVRPVDESPGS